MVEPNISTSDGTIKLTNNLLERIKELNCLYGISKLIENRDMPLEKVVEQIAEIIPPAWQYPEITESCIKITNKLFKTKHYRDTPWHQTENILVDGKVYGFVTVCYLEARPLADEGPFLKEERALLRVIAERLGTFIEYKLAERKSRTLYDREKRLRKKLQAEMQNRISFTRKLIHELKTPLTSLIATSQLLLDETRNTRLEKLAGFVFQGAQNLNQRIEELHDVIRGETGLLKLDKKPLDIGKLLANFVEEMQPLSQRNNIVVCLELKEKLPLVLADKERIRQVLYNLINNAFRYAASGKKVVISAKCENKSVIIETKDFGPGISTKKQRNLFKPHYQSTYYEDKTEGQGLGIGLTLCKMLVELHGGKILLKSKLGKGSSFFFSIPVIELENQKPED